MVNWNVGGKLILTSLLSGALLACGTKQELPQDAPSSSLVPPPVVTSPSVSSVFNNQDDLVLSGSCDVGLTVSVSGAHTESALCADGSFSFSVNKTSDAQYNFTLNQVDQGLGEVSSDVSISWTRDTVAPSAPAVVSPSTPYLSNTNVVTLNGSCESGATVEIDGASSSSTVCTASNTFSFSLSSSVDGTYNFTLKQIDLATNESAVSNFDWTRDTVAPLAPVILSPASNPYNSDESSFSLSGSCEAGSQVSLSGDQVESQSCASGSFLFTLSKSVDGTYNYSLSASDLAGNVSSSVSFQWIRYTPQGTPPTPILSSPTPNPHLSNTNSIIIAGTCVSGNTVTLSGDVVAGDVTNPAGSLTTSCVSNSFSFTVGKSVDGTYNIDVTQTNSDLATSPAATATWTRDTVAPAQVVIAVPATNPYSSAGDLTISGSCESDATVTLSGDDSQQVTCVSNSFSFTVVESIDGVYSYDLSQTDVAGNVSAIVTLDWTRSSAVVPDPTIDTPVASPYLSNDPSLVISGVCNDGYTVTLSGFTAGEVTSPAGSLTQVCSSNFYSFSVTRSSEGSAIIGAMQTYLGTDSNVVTKEWVLDTTVPETTITTSPSGMNYLYGDVSISFESNEVGATFECSLNGGAYAACSSPHVISNPANGSYSFSVRAKDLVNTDATPAVASWTQEAHQTVALYHMDSADTFTDFSNYSGAQSNSLTNNNGVADASGQFAQAQAFSGSSAYARVMDNLSQDTLNGVSTLEFWFKPSALPGNNQYMALVSKAGSSGNFGWSILLKKQGGGSNYKLVLRGSLDGTAVTEVAGTNFTPTVGAWAHFAVTFNRGDVALYYNGALVGTGAIGTAGSSVLYSSTADLQVGGTHSMGTVNSAAAGSFDEVRFSQVIRYTGAFTPSASAFAAD